MVENKIKEYLKSIKEKSSALHKRILEILNMVSEFNVEPIDDIVITDYKNEEGKRVYESLFFVSENYLLEAKNFRKDVVLDIVKYTLSVRYIEIKCEDYKFYNATPDSELAANVVLKHGTVAVFKATGYNCDILLKFIFSHLRNNIIE